VSALRVVCPNCQRVTVVDGDKLPDQPVSYRCPACQAKVIVDKRKLLMADTAELTPGPTAAQPPQPQAAASPPAPRPPSGADRPMSAAAAGLPDPLFEMALPPGHSIPPGILVAEDAESAAQVRRQLEPYDCTLELVADAGTARERILLEPPPLVVYAADAVSKPPYSPLEPIVSLPSRERRQVFLLLVAPNVKTLDGNLAFLYQVDLLLNRQQVPQAAAILHSALVQHQRFYRPFLAALTE
jgi:hypothetical protein